MTSIFKISSFDNSCLYNNYIKYSSDTDLINTRLKNDMGIYLFCYGSNSIEQVKERTKNYELKSKKAYLPNYSRIFSGKSNKWNGAVASIIENNNNKIKELLIFLKEKHLDKLDKFVGANKNINPFSKKDNLYSRKYLTVKDENHNDIKCITYIKNNHEWILPPSEEYLTSIRNHLKQHWDEYKNDLNELYIFDKNFKMKGTF